eukprot:10129211-Alexandrium_andersonii.AAC.1
MGQWKTARRRRARAAARECFCSMQEMRKSRMQHDVESRCGCLKICVFHGLAVRRETVQEGGSVALADR